jgi:hypothetical protein
MHLGDGHGSKQTNTLIVSLIMVVSLSRPSKTTTIKLPPDLLISTSRQEHPLSVFGVQMGPRSHRIVDVLRCCQQLRVLFGHPPHLLRGMPRLAEAS